MSAGHGGSHILYTRTIRVSYRTNLPSVGNTGGSRVPDGTFLTSGRDVIDTATYCQVEIPPTGFYETRWRIF